MIETIPNTSALAAKLRRRIKREGPITFCDWMMSALYDADDGYYCQAERKRWGREGDYRTSPESSSLFAATFACYFARLYHELDEPPQWIIMEVGAGDGTFAGGVLRTLRDSFPQVYAATRYAVDEISSHSAALARARLEPFADRVQFKKLEDIEIPSGIIFSNELLDAFPVHRVAMHDGTLREFYINVAPDGSFEWTLGPLSTPRLNEYFEDCDTRFGEGHVAEVSLKTEDWLRNVADSMGSGCLITVDYGAAAADLYSSTAGRQGTLRSFFRHQFVNDVLARPGEQDLTSTVNWTFVRKVGARLGFEVTEFNRQDKFLLAAGFLDELELELQRCKDEAERVHLSTAAREMILPDGMASHFQVMVQKKGLMFTTDQSAL